VRAVRFERALASGYEASTTYGFPAAEYAADFVLAGRRALKKQPLEAAVFRFHFEQALDWRHALPAINKALALPKPLDRGSFFHAVYRVEEAVGRELATVHPYPLFPACDYFSGLASVPVR
jgi:hypothetical protein